MSDFKVRLVLIMRINDLDHLYVATFLDHFAAKLQGLRPIQERAQQRSLATLLHTGHEHDILALDLIDHLLHGSERHEQIQEIKVHLEELLSIVDVEVFRQLLQFVVLHVHPN